MSLTLATASSTFLVMRLSTASGLAPGYAVVTVLPDASVTVSERRGLHTPYDAAEASAAGQ